MPNKLKKAARKVSAVVSNARDRVKGYTTQKGGTTTTTKESSTMRRYNKGKDSTKVTKTKEVKPTKTGYSLTKTKTKQKGVKKYGAPTKTKTSTKNISERRAAKVIKKGQKRQEGFKTLKQAGVRNYKQGGLVQFD